MHFIFQPFFGHLAWPLFWGRLLSAMTNTPRGIFAIVIGLCIAASTGAIMKLLGDSLTPIQVTWLRFTGFALIMFPVVVFHLGADKLRPARPVIQFFRGITMASATVAFIAGVRTVDFADAIAILYAYPFLLTCLAVIFLDERVSWVGWIGVLGGFAGVLLVMRPEFSSLNTGTLLVFACAVIVAIQMVMNRKLGTVSHPLVTSLWGATIASLALLPLLFSNWQSLQSVNPGLIAAMIASGAISQLLIVWAFAHTPASTLAPFTYFEIVAAVTLGFFVFGTVPSWLSWVGIALISISGILVARSLPGRHTPRRNPKI